MISGADVFFLISRAVATPSKSFISISRKITSNTASFSARTRASPQSNSVILKVSPDSSSSVSYTHLQGIVDFCREVLAGDVKELEVY